MTEKTALARNIEALAKQKGLSLRALARLTGLSSSSVSSIVNRGATPRAKNVKAIADILGVHVDDLYSSELKVRVPVKGEIQGFPVPLLTLDQLGDIGRGDTENVKPAGWMPEAPFADCSDESIVAVYAEGSALDPAICTGDLLYVKGVPYTDPETTVEVEEGDYVLALAQGLDRPVVRILVKGDAGDDWLVADNPRYPGETKLRLAKVLGVVVAKATRIR